jgi:hypothetical protein
MVGVVDPESGLFPSPIPEKKAMDPDPDPQHWYKANHQVTLITKYKASRFFGYSFRRITSHPNKAAQIIKKYDHFLHI